MAKKKAEEKTLNKYLITLRWYVETDEELVSGAKESDDKLLDILRHRTDGKESCKSCPTRNQEGYAILDYHYFMGDKPTYMSVDKIAEKTD